MNANKDSILSNIPQTLKELSRWILWRLERRDGTETKVPYRTDGMKASTTNPNDWTNFDTAVRAFNPERYNGLGFVLRKEDNIVCIDLDGCIGDDGKICDEAKSIVRIMNSWTEISQSGKGLHIFIRGKKPTDKSKATPRSFKSLEIYDHARYIALTGNHLPGTPLEITKWQWALNTICVLYFPERESTPPQTIKPHHDSLSDDEIIALCRKAQNAPKFVALYDNGDASLYDGDESRADEALACLLAFYTQDAAQLERLMNASALARREKWRQREDYRRRTIQKAISLTREHYNAKHNSTVNLDSYPLTKINPVPENDLDDFEEIPTLDSYANIDYAFDESLLPNGIFREIYDYIKREADAPAQFIFTGVMAMLCGIAGTRISLLCGIQKFKPHDYFTLIASSGGGKSTTLESVRAILSALEKEITDKDKPYQNVFLYPQSSTLRGLLDVMREESEAELQAREIAREKGKPEPPQKFAQRSGVAIIDEVSALFDATKSDFNSGLDATLLELWDGNPRMIATSIRTDGKMRFEDTALTLLSASTPRKFVERLPKGAFLDGMLPRFQIINAGNRTQPRKPLTSFTKRQANHSEIVEKLKHFHQFVCGLSQSQTPVLISDEARALDEQSLQVWHEESMNLKDETSEAYMMRIDTRKVRYALLFSILESYDQHGRFADAITLTGTAMQKAIEVCDFFKTHTLHFLVKAKAIKPKAPNEREPMPERIKNKLIELGGTVDKRDLYRAMNLDEQTFMTALNQLLETKQVVLTKRKNIKGRNVDMVSIPKKMQNGYDSMTVMTVCKINTTVTSPKPQNASHCHKSHCHNAYDSLDYASLETTVPEPTVAPESQPTVPEPINPQPTVPEPTVPGPTVPEPMPAPSEPEPIQPMPAPPEPEPPQPMPVVELETEPTIAAKPVVKPESLLLANACEIARSLHAKFTENEFLREATLFGATPQTAKQMIYALLRDGYLVRHEHIFVRTEKLYASEPQAKPKRGDDGILPDDEFPF
jgi:hypothetical protein